MNFQFLFHRWALSRVSYVNLLKIISKKYKEAEQWKLALSCSIFIRFTQPLKMHKKRHFLVHAQKRIELEPTQRNTSRCFLTLWKFFAHNVRIHFSFYTIFLANSENKHIFIILLLFRPPFINGKASGYCFSFLEKALTTVFEELSPFFSFASFLKRSHQGPLGPLNSSYVAHGYTNDWWKKMKLLWKWYHCGWSAPITLYFT